MNVGDIVRLFVVGLSVGSFVGKLVGDTVRKQLKESELSSNVYFGEEHDEQVIGRGLISQITTLSFKRLRNRRKSKLVIRRKLIQTVTTFSS